MKVKSLELNISSGKEALRFSLQNKSLGVNLTRQIIERFKACGGVYREGVIDRAEDFFYLAAAYVLFDNLSNDSDGMSVSYFMVTKEKINLQICAIKKIGTREKCSLLSLATLSDNVRRVFSIAEYDHKLNVNDLDMAVSLNGEIESEDDFERLRYLVARKNIARSLLPIAELITGVNGKYLKSFMEKYSHIK
jgi:hypothetical protein